MASLIDTLIETLIKENEEYETLLELSMEKTGIIVRSDHDGLNEIVMKEQKVVERINVLEKKRSEVTNDIGVVLNRKPQELTLTKLVEMLANQPRECGMLKEIHDKLSKTLSRMVQVNESNKALLNESLEMLQFEMNLLQSMKQAPETTNYSGNTYANNSYGGMASFDAKQ